MTFKTVTNVSAAAPRDAEGAGASVGVQMFTVDEHADGQRLDNFLMSRLRGLPKTRLYRAIRKGEIRINKKRCKPDTRICINDVVRVAPLRLAADAENVAPGEALQSRIRDSILYEDNTILVLDKPAGIAVHAGTGSKVGVIEVLRHIYGDRNYLELVHRLDKETSGVLLVARSGKALKVLQNAFRHKQTEKIYLALVHGRWPGRITRVDTALQRYQPTQGERIVKAEEGGKASETLFCVIEQFPQATLIEARPLTGRTHQIRVHCQQAGHPIIGDAKYTYHRAHDFGAVRFLNLHAVSLAFNHPESGAHMKFEAPLRDEIRGLCENMRKISVESAGQPSSV